MGGEFSGGALGHEIVQLSVEVNKEIQAVWQCGQPSSQAAKAGRAGTVQRATGLEAIRDAIKRDMRARTALDEMLQAYSVNGNVCWVDEEK